MFQKDLISQPKSSCFLCTHHFSLTFWFVFSDMIAQLAHLLFQWVKTDTTTSQHILSCGIMRLLSLTSKSMVKPSVQPSLTDPTPIIQIEDTHPALQSLTLQKVKTCKKINKMSESQNTHDCYLNVILVLSIQVTRCRLFTDQTLTRLLWKYPQLVATTVSPDSGSESSVRAVEYKK